ncbi:MAG: lipid-A-disaccharide synthase [Rhabdochlamydiaceae bacterium]
MTDIFICAGEASGDLIGASLIKDLKEQNPSLSIAGVGGRHMKDLEIDLVESIDQLQVMGFIHVFRHLPRLFKIFRKLRRYLLNKPPKVIVFIDYPGFNLRLARQLRKKGFNGQIVHYVCPSVWAWGKDRIKIIENNIDLLLCLLPFEPALFNPKKIKAIYIGHPLVKQISCTNKNIERKENLIALFPGSRRKEIEKNLPLQIASMQPFNSLHIGISVASISYMPMIAKIVESSGLSHSRVSFYRREKSYDLMRQAFLAIAKCGTTILELALHKTPTIVVYHMNKIDTVLARHLFKINLPFYSLPNIILQKEVFPELIGPNLSFVKLKETLSGFLSSKTRRENCQDKCSELVTQLETTTSSVSAASLILKLIS